ncbi:hypothetical protein ET464_02210 [Paenibacillus protaetiae]|uniref:Uncharacterized protein n=1 Tax=Paenibacillus protaetiae TaxID=2509456 RepID=A0A4P6EQW6_9BACL|nr:hypothetical protein ET464_02210 [Paenibacillus protaetiae]
MPVGFRPPPLSVAVSADAEADGCGVLLGLLELPALFVPELFEQANNNAEHNTSEAVTDHIFLPVFKYEPSLLNCFL